MGIIRRHLVDIKIAKLLLFASLFTGLTACLRTQMIGSSSISPSSSSTTGSSATTQPATPPVTPVLAVAAAAHTPQGAGQSVDLEISNGKAPYTVSFLSGGGALDPSSLVLSAGWFAQIVAVVTDSLGVSGQVTVATPPKGLSWGGNGAEWITGVEITSDLGIVYYGQTTSTVFVDAGLSAMGGGDVVMVKYDSQGNEVFSKVMGTSAVEGIQNHGVSSDSQGNIYFTGQTLGSFPTFTNPGGGWDGMDAFVGKVDSEGNTKWISEYTYTEDQASYGLTTNPTTGTSTMLGWSQVAIPGSMSSFAGGVTDCVLMQISSAGVWGKVNDFGTPANDICRVITQDSEGNIYVGGYGSGALSGFSNAGGNYCSMFAKYDSNLNQIWEFQLPCAVASYPTALAVDSTGDVYFSGYTPGALFGPLTGTNDFMYGKLDGTNGTLVWGKQMGISGGDASADSVQSIRVLSDGSVVLTADTTGAWPTFTSQGGIDGYLMRIDGNGNILWTKQLASPGDDTVVLAVDANDYIYAAVSGTGSVLGATTPYPTTEDVTLFKFDSNGVEQ